MIHSVQKCSICDQEKDCMDIGQEIGEKKPVYVCHDKCYPRVIKEGYKALKGGNDGSSSCR